MMMVREKHKSVLFRKIFQAMHINRHIPSLIGMEIDPSQEAVQILLRVFIHVSCTVDRKSTRLNSSHVSISYAVFCLKEKITATLDGLSSPCITDLQALFGYV